MFHGKLMLKVNVILLECTHCKHAMQIHLFLIFKLTFDLDQGTMKVTLRSFPGLSGFLPMMRNLDLRSL